LFVNEYVVLKYLEVIRQMTEHQFEIIFKEYFTYLSNIAFPIVKDRDDAYDVVQQVFIKLWDKRDSIDTEINIKSYLYRATFNTALNFIEKNKRSVSLNTADINEETTNFSADFFSGEVEDAIEKAIFELPEKCQMVFMLSRYSDLSNKDIAEKLNISVKGVEKHISKALKELRVKLKRYIE
jgi:RNA polymerase sigma-70 factor (ECF subfamily)